MPEQKKRDSVIEGLNSIHGVACGLGGDQCYLNGIGIKQLQTLINDATDLLKAQESPTDEAIEDAVFCLQHPHDCCEDEVMAARKMALDALMAQRHVKPVALNLGLANERYICGECGGSFFGLKVNFCPWCSTKAKWE